MAQGLVDLDFSIEEDELIQGLIDAKGKPVEVVAFGIFYSGILSAVEIDRGTITITDGDDHAVLEVERIESFSMVIS
jgi:hypothetical protein